ncbi:MAG: cell wall hydrolase [Bacteroidales bacterium]|nr:cell wall hydrolase [Bacteroidales bacterium]
MKLLIVFFAILLCVSPACASETFDMDTDYAELMIASALIGDTENGRKYELLRNQKKEALGIEDSLSYDDLFLLAKIVENEAGSIWLSDDHRKCVASVVINRVNSTEFPDILEDVIFQKGQYSGVNTEYFEDLLPSEPSVRAALEIIIEGSILPPSVVFQSEFIQGSGIHSFISDDKLETTTYFCYSNYPELYE